MPSLFDPIQLGDLHLPNRIFMAPLTRLRGTPEHIPTPLMIEYYTQRASAGLIISEGTPVDPMGVGYANVPGIWSPRRSTTQVAISSRRSGTLAASPIPSFSMASSPSLPAPSQHREPSACFARSVPSLHRVRLRSARSKTWSRHSVAARRTPRPRDSTA